MKYGLKYGHQILEEKQGLIEGVHTYHTLNLNKKV
jgi:hypothetical protein